jgi:hypothetical protein
VLRSVLRSNRSSTSVVIRELCACGG